MYSLIIIGIWSAWAFYWLISARNTKQNRRIESAASRYRHSLPLFIAAIILFIPPELADFVDARFLPRTLLAYWIGVAVLLFGIGFAIWARVHLGSNWSGTVTLKKEHELIRTGPYSIVRHPIYTGLLTGFLGTAISMGQWRALLALCLFFLGFWLKIQLEEAWMIETFKEEYERYRSKVKALIPFVL